MLFIGIISAIIYIVTMIYGVIEFSINLKKY